MSEDTKDSNDGSHQTVAQEAIQLQQAREKQQELMQDLQKQREILLRQLDHAGLGLRKNRHKSKTKKSASRLQVLLDGEDIFIIQRSNKQKPHAEKKRSEAYLDSNYGGYGSYGGYGAYGGYGSYGGYGGYGIHITSNRIYSEDFNKHSSETICIQIKQGKRVNVETGLDAERIAQRVIKRFNRP